MKLMEPDYSNSILNVSHTILAHYGHKTNYDLIPELKLILDKNYQHVFLVLLDGMGTNILKRYLKKKDFLKKHFKKEITSIYPPTTVAATNAVLTAKPPYESGYLGWNQYFEKEDVYDIIFLNKDYYDDTKILDKNFRETYLKHDTIFDYIKRANQNVEVSSLWPSFIKGGYHSFDAQLDKVVEISLLNKKTFTYVYWTNPDDKEHKFGPFSKEVKVELKALSKSFEQIKDKLGQSSCIIVIADHGQIGVKPIEFNEHHMMYHMLDKKPSLEPRTPTFFVKDDKHLDFRMMFTHMFEDKFKLYTGKDFIESGLIGRGVKHEMLDSFIGDFVGVATSNYYLKFKPTAIYKGHHAGLTKDEMEVPLIIFEKE